MQGLIQIATLNKFWSSLYGTFYFVKRIFEISFDWNFKSVTFEIFYRLFNQRCIALQLKKESDVFRFTLKEMNGRDLIITSCSYDQKRSRMIGLYGIKAVLPFYLYFE